MTTPLQKDSSLPPLSPNKMGPTTHQNNNNRPTSPMPTLEKSASSGSFTAAQTKDPRKTSSAGSRRSASATSSNGSKTRRGNRSSSNFQKRSPSVDSSTQRRKSPSSSNKLSILEKHKHAVVTGSNNNDNRSNKSRPNNSKRSKKALQLWKSAEKTIIEKSLYSSVARVPFSLDRLSDFRSFFMDDLGMYDKELSEDEFIEVFQEALSGRRFSRQELSAWFKDIDVDCGESVSWDEFSTFILTQTKIEQKLARDMDRARDFIPDITYPLPTTSHHRHLSEQLLTLGTPKFQGFPDGNVFSASSNNNDNNSNSINSNNNNNNQQHHDSNGLLSILTASLDGSIKLWSKGQHDIHEACGRPANEPHLLCGFDNFSTEVQGVNTTTSVASSAIMNLLQKSKQQQNENNSNNRDDDDDGDKNSPSSGSMMKKRRKKNANTNIGGMKYSPIVDICVAAEGNDGNFFVLGSDRTINIFNARTQKITLRFKGYPSAASRFIRATLGSERGIFASEPRDGVPLVRMLDMNDFPASICVARCGHFATTAARDPSITFQGDEVFFFGMQSGELLAYPTERHTIRALRNPIKIFGNEVDGENGNNSTSKNSNNNQEDPSSMPSSPDSLLVASHRIAYGAKIHTDRIHLMKYASAFGGLITASWDGTMRITDVESGKTNYSFDCINQRFSVASDYVPPENASKKHLSRFYHAGGIPITTCGFGSGAEDIDLVDLKHQNAIVDFALNDKDHLIATVAGEYQCLIWSPSLSAHPIGILKSTRSKIIAVCFAPDQQLAITLDQVGGVVRIWDLKTNCQRQFFHFKDHESAPPEARTEIPRRISYESRTGSLVAVKRAPCTWTLRRRIAASSIHNDAPLTMCLVDTATSGGWLFSCDAQEVAAFSIRKGTRKLMFVPFHGVSDNAGSSNNNNKKLLGAGTNNKNSGKADDNDDAGNDNDEENSATDSSITTTDIKNPISAVGLDRHERRIYFCSKDGLCRVFNARTGMYLSQVKPAHYKNSTTRISSPQQQQESGEVVAVVPLTSGDKLSRIVAIVVWFEVHFVWDSFDARFGADVEFNRNKAHRVLKLKDQIPLSSSSSSTPKILHAVRGLDPDDKGFVPYLILGLDDGRILIVNAITTSVSQVLRGADKTIFNSLKSKAKHQQQQQQEREEANERRATKSNADSAAQQEESPGKALLLSSKPKPKFIEIKEKKSAPEELIENHMAEKESSQVQLNENATGEMRIEDMILIRSKDLLVVVFENSPLIEMWNVRFQHHIVSRVTWPVNMVPRRMANQNQHEEVNNNNDTTSSNASPTSPPSSPTSSKRKAKPPAPCFTAVTCDSRGEVMFCGDFHGNIYVFDITALNPQGSCTHWLRGGASHNAAVQQLEIEQQQQQQSSSPLKSALDTATKKKAFFSSIARRAGLAAKQERIFEMRKLASRKPKNVGPQTICLRLMKVFRGHSEAVLKLSYSDSSQRLLSQGADLVVHCWTGAGKHIGFFGPKEPFHSADLSALYKDKKFKDQQREEEKKRKKEHAESLLAKSQRQAEEAEQKRREEKKKQKKQLLKNNNNKKKASRRSPSPPPQQAAAAAAVAGGAEASASSTHPSPTTAELGKTETELLSSTGQFSLNEQDEDYWDENDDNNTSIINTDDDDDSDDSDEYDIDEGGQKTLRGSAIADPLIQAAILTDEEKQDCPEIVMVERIALVIPEDPLHEDSPEVKAKRKLIPPGEEYYTVHNFNIDKVEGSLDYNQFLTKVTSGDFGGNRCRNNQNASGGGGKNANKKSSLLLSMLKNNKDLMGSQQNSSNGGENVTATAESENKKSNNDEDEDADDDKLLPSMSLVKASTLMLRKDSKNINKQQQKETTEKEKNQETGSPMLASSVNNANESSFRRKFEMQLSTFAASSSSPDDGFFLTSTSVNEESSSQQPRSRSVLSMTTTSTNNKHQNHHGATISFLQNSSLPPILASSTRLKNPLHRASHTHVKNITQAQEQRQAQKARDILMGLRNNDDDDDSSNNIIGGGERRAFTPSPQKSSTNDNNTDTSFSGLTFTALKKRHEKQQGHLDIMPVSLRTPDGIKKLINESKNERKLKQHERVHQREMRERESSNGNNNTTDKNSSGSINNRNDANDVNNDEDDPRSALRIPIETLDYLQEKPRKIKLKSLGVRKKLGMKW